LVGYLRSSNFIVLWSNRKAFLSDERHYEAVRSASRDQWDGRDGPLECAVSAVLATTGEAFSTLRGGVLSCDAGSLRRLQDRAGLSPASHPLGFVDRHGMSHQPFEYAFELARAFAAAEPLTVLAQIDIEEREMLLAMREPGEAYRVPLVGVFIASNALVRQWAGHDAAVNERRAEVDRLRAILDRAVRKLMRPKSDPVAVARWIERAVRGH
jgi:hypothetical protein